MLEIATLLFGILLAQISPGPNLVAVAGAALGSGRTVGIATALGVAFGVLFWAAGFALGVGAIIAAYPETLTAMRLVGGGYLLYLGIRGVAGALRGGGGGSMSASQAMGSREGFRRGLLVNSTNPKTAIMWVAIAMVLAGIGSSPLQMFLLGIVVSLSAAMVYSTYAVLFSTGLAHRGYQRFYRWVDGAFGLVFGSVGGKMIWDGLKEVRL